MLEGASFFLSEHDLRRFWTRELTNGKQAVVENGQWSKTG